MAKRIDSKVKYEKDAASFAEIKERISKEQIELLRYLKADLTNWYNALIAVCFTVGGIAITIGADKNVQENITYPKYFWWGATLLLINGLIIFTYKKNEIERNFRDLPKLRITERDLWKVEKIALELAKGDSSRVDEFNEIKARITLDYEESTKSRTLFRWVVGVFLAIKTDLIFGIMLFALLLMFSQIITFLNIKFNVYNKLLILTAIAYVIYVITEVRSLIKSEKLALEAEQDIKKEILKD